MILFVVPIHVLASSSSSSSSSKDQSLARIIRQLHFRAVHYKKQQAKITSEGEVGHLNKERVDRLLLFITQDVSYSSVLEKAKENKILTISTDWNENELIITPFFTKAAIMKKRASLENPDEAYTCNVKIT